MGDIQNDLLTTMIFFLGDFTDLTCWSSELLLYVYIYSQ